MKFARRIVFSLLATAAVPFHVAIAADYEPPIVIDEAPEVVPVEVGSGWYLRGDLSYNVNKSVYDVDIGLPGVEGEHTRFGFGGGVGYHFTDYFRSDINLAYVSYDDYTFASPFGDVKFRNTDWTALANVYLDLGTVAGFTPYVGFGAVALVSNTRLEAGAPGFGLVDNQTNFAYSANAGIAYRLRNNVSVDVGYQYLSSPDAQYLDYESMTVKDGVDYHQVRVGLRYDLW